MAAHAHQEAPPDSQTNGEGMEPQPPVNFHIDCLVEDIEPADPKGHRRPQDGRGKLHPPGDGEATLPTGQGEVPPGKMTKGR